MTPVPYEDPSDLALDARPEVTAAAIIETVRDAIATHPRTLQLQIGPSEIGTPCGRLLAYKLLQVPPVPRDYVQATDTKWAATVGTAVHEWLAGVFEAQNMALASFGQPDRWCVEEQVTVGCLPDGTPITGHADLYDRLTGTVWDWKIPGVTKLKHVRSHGPNQTYRTQAHLYGQGFVNAGLPVRHVGIIFLPRTVTLADRVVWHEPFDPQVATEALERLAGVHVLTTLAGADAPAHLAPTWDYCRYCDYFKPGTVETDAVPGCPGGVDPNARPTAPALKFGA